MEILKAFGFICTGSGFDFFCDVLVNGILILIPVALLVAPVAIYIIARKKSNNKLFSVLKVSVILVGVIAFALAFWGFYSFFLSSWLGL